MDSHTLIYRGPSSSEDPKAARRIADAISARWPFSESEALARLSRTPFVLCGGLSKDLALLFKKYLQGFGANVEITSVPALQPISSVSTAAQPAAPPRQWYLRSSLRGAISALASGLLLSTVVIGAGIILMFLTGVLSGPGRPPELFSATGWVAVAVGLVILIGIIVLRLRELVRIVSPPDQTTPLQTMRSLMRALSERNWHKAVRCLAGRPGSDDLGSRPQREIIKYLRSLAKVCSLPREVDPAQVTLQYSEDANAILRFHVEVMNRKPTSEGSYLRRTFLEARRFVKINESWFILDGYLLAQPDPTRLPAPACPECGAGSELGRGTCGACGATFSAPLLTDEEWQTPRRRPDLAALMSAFVPGLGQAYNGQSLKALLFAATCWAVLPWAAGVIDAMRTAERINRNAAYHDPPARALPAVLVHLTVIAATIALLVALAKDLPMIGPMVRSVFEADVQDQPLFSEPEGRYTVLFPADWEVRQERDETGRPVVLAISEDGNSTVRISSQNLPRNWQPCQQAHQAKGRLESEGATVETFRCGFIRESLGYRLDSYSSDRRWRRSLIVVAVGKDLIDTAFACPSVDQAELVPIFERVADSIQYSESPVRK